MTVPAKPTAEIPEPPEFVDPARRGVLIIEARAAEHVVEGVLARSGPQVTSGVARVTSITDDGVELDVDVTLQYPTVPVSGVLRQLRLTVADEAGRLLGRPVRHLDVTVSKFVHPPNAALRNRSQRVI
jgi:uncharacterized alkaline shock family protein YloU